MQRSFVFRRTWLHVDLVNWIMCWAVAVVVGCSSHTFSKVVSLCQDEKGRGENFILVLRDRLILSNGHNVLGCHPSPWTRKCTRCFRCDAVNPSRRNMSKTQARLIAVGDYKSPLRRIRYVIFTELEGSCFAIFWVPTQYGREVARFRTDVLPPAAKLQRGVMARKATVEVQVASACSRLSRIFVAEVYCAGRHVYIGFTSNVSPIVTVSLNMGTSTEWLITNGTPNREEDPPFHTISCDAKITWCGRKVMRLIFF